MIALVIPCWNASDLAAACLARVARFSRRTRTIVVDDGSTPAHARKIAAAARRAGAELLRLPANGGYPRAVNAGLARRRDEEFVVLGNADAAATEGWEDAMAAAFEDPKVAAVSPACNPPRRAGRAPWADPPRYADLAALDRFAAALSLRPEPAFREARGFVPGFWLMVRAKALEKAGSLDERFSPGGYEDWDLQWRLREAGWKVGFAPRAYVHHAGTAVVRANGVSPRSLFTAARRALLTRKHPATKGLKLEALCP